MKKKIIAIALIVVLIAVAILTTCLVMFLPKKLSEYVDADGILSVQLYKGEELYKQLSAMEIEDFVNVVNSTKYKSRYVDIKAATLERIVITYSGGITEISGYTIKKADNDGKKTGKRVYIDMAAIYKNF